MNDHYPHFVHHKQMKEYFQNYMNHFGFADRVMFNHEVQNSQRTEDGHWRLTVRNTKTDQVHIEDFHFLVVATGHDTISCRLPVDWTPFLHSGGKVLTAQQYRGPIQFANKKVLVIGGSISGIDLSLDLISTAAAVVHAMRSPIWIMEKRIGGKIYDEAMWRRSALYMPQDQFLLSVVNTLKAADTNPGKHGGLMASDKLFVESCLAVGSGNYIDALLNGQIVQRTNIKTVNPDGSITFEDGHSETFDVVIEAIGYKISFPFLPKELTSEILDPEGNYVKLFHWAFHPDIFNLAFIGQYKSLAAYNPQYELQGRWVSYVWKGIRSLPKPEDMKKWITEILIPIETSRYPRRPHFAIMEDFAAVAGVVPIPENNVEIKDLLNDGLLLGALYRLDGPGAKKKEATELIIKWNKEFNSY